MKSIRVENITKVYNLAKPDERAVDDVSLSIEAGEFVFLLGPSGCGKTTLLRAIAGLTPPSAGRVFLGDVDVTDRPVNQRNTAMVFQNYALWPHMTVDQNVQFGPKMKRVPAAARRATAEKFLSIVQMTEFKRRKPMQLSGGQQQRVALARALAAEPDCLLLDEPLSNLDAKLRLQMRGELRRLVKDSGVTAVYVTHDQKEALSMADRVAVMNDGRIEQTGTPHEVYDRPVSRFVADFLGEANFIDGQVVQAGPVATIDTPAGRLPARDASAHAVGKTVTCCLRPEGLSLGGGEVSLSATVVDCEFLGETIGLTCELAGGERWKVTALTGGPGAVSVGSGVSIGLSSDSAWILPSSSGGS